MPDSERDYQIGIQENDDRKNTFQESFAASKRVCGELA